MMPHREKGGVVRTVPHGEKGGGGDTLVAATGSALAAVRADRRRSDRGRWRLAGGALAQSRSVDSIRV
jgi:hypothetical protein